MDNKKSILKSLRSGVLVVAAIIIYAYGFKITKVNFETARDENRLSQLSGIMRKLARPNIVEYEQESSDIDYPLYLPCPDEGLPTYEPDTSQPYLMMEPACGGPEEFVELSGYNLWPNESGDVNFIPPSGAMRKLGAIQTDENGHFTNTIQLPNRQPVAEAQIIRVSISHNVGTPHFSEMALITWEKILETIFLALLATTFGTLLAIPVSFIAARNLMANENNPLSGAALSLIGWPIGIFIGQGVAKVSETMINALPATITFMIAGMIITPIIAWVFLRIAFSYEDELKGSKVILLWILWLLAIIFGIVGFIYLIENALYIGQEFSSRADMPILAFFAKFISQLGDLAQIFFTLSLALAFGGAVGSTGSKIGGLISDRLPPGLVRIINIIVTGIAVAGLFAAIGAGIDWLYLIKSPELTLWWPAGIGAVIGMILAIVISPQSQLPTGLVIYYITRTLLNGIRSMEPLVMVIIFVVWVGIGPFAGTLALALHTIAALAKLYSEQVESILPGPLEAIRSTGANRIQTIVYAVVPQIIPPYISFTMYRWDINVRMSTIIGFAGGGGIGFILAQNINLLQYRDASVNMLAIAIVVASMDYISSVLRERFV